MKPIQLSPREALKGFLLVALIGNVSWGTTTPTGEASLASTEAARLDCRGKDKNDERCRLTEEQRSQAAKESDEIRRQVEAAQKERGAPAPAITKTAPPRPTSQKKTSNNAPENDDSSSEASTSCIDCVSTAPAKPSNEVQDFERITRTIEKNTASTEEVARCELDRQGEELSDLAAFECQSRRLALLKGKANADERRDVIEELEDLFDSLRKQIKSALSGDKDERRDGERALAKMLAALNKVKFDKDADRKKLISSLKSLRAGAEALSTARELDKEVNELESEIKTEYRQYTALSNKYQESCRSRTGCDRDLQEDLQDSKAALGDLSDRHRELARDISDKRSEVMDDLEEYDDVMTNTDRRDYTNRFKKLQSRMDDLRDLRNLDSKNRAFHQTPSDLDQVRRGDIALRRGNNMFSIDQYHTMQSPIMGSPQNMGWQQQQTIYTPPYLNPGMTQQIPGAIPVPGQVGYAPQPYNYTPGTGLPGGGLLPAPTGMGMQQPFTPMGQFGMQQPFMPGTPMGMPTTGAIPAPIR